MSFAASAEDRKHPRPGADSPGLAAHCRRVAALALEVGRRLRLSSLELQTLEQAALLHHTPFEFTEPETLRRLMSDIACPRWRETPGDEISEQAPERQVREVLKALRHRAGADPETVPAVLAQLIELCEFFDERLEFLPFEPWREDRMLVEFSWMASDGLYHPKLVAALTGLRQIRKQDLVDTVDKLPVYPTVVLQLLALPPEEESALEEMARLASSDQTLAGHVLKAANAALYGPAQTISDIRHAITYIGARASRRVMMAAAVGPLFASAALRDLWRHSLEMADLAEQLATLSKAADPSEAFLAGLVHDLGRLAIQKLPARLTGAHARMLEQGCPPVFVEMALCGIDHGEAGAEGLRLWLFPEQLVAAVQYHHQPEQTDSKLASILYLAEHWCASEEDLPSVARLRHATEAIGVTLEDLRALEIPKAGALIA